jgi:hypothetical protein
LATGNNREREEGVGGFSHPFRHARRQLRIGEDLSLMGLPPAVSFRSGFFFIRARGQTGQLPADPIDVFL